MIERACTNIFTDMKKVFEIDTNDHAAPHSFTLS